MKFEEYKMKCFEAYCAAFPGEYDPACPVECEEFYSLDRQTISWAFNEGMTPAQVCAEFWS